MSRAVQIADSTVLLILNQRREDGSRWHVAECSFLVVTLYPGYQDLPCVITDDLIARLSAKTSHPRGYRLMTAPEIVAWHVQQRCWPRCQRVQIPRDDGLPSHIRRECTARCRAIQDTIARNAVSLGVPESRLRKLAGSRHEIGRYLTDDGDTLRALYDGGGSVELRRGTGHDRGRNTHGQVR